MSVDGGAAQDGVYAVSASTAGSASGTAYLGLQCNIRIDPLRNHMLSVYLRQASPGEISIKMPVACFNTRNRYTVSVQLTNPAVLRPVASITPLGSDGAAHPSAKWTRFGGLLPRDSCPRNTRAVKLQFFFSYPTGSQARILLDSVQFERGTGATPFVRRGRNLVSDPSFETGGFAN